MRIGAAVVGALVGLIGLAVPAIAAPPDPDPADVDRFVADYVDRHGLAGVSAVVVRDGEVVHTTGAGDGVTADTPLAVGSVSKMFTAFAVLQLVDAGEVGLDDPVVEHLPEFEMDDPRAADITVRQLLSHTSGMPNPTLVPPTETLADAAGLVADWQLAGDPGTAYRYSNFNYRVAARLVEVVTGVPFADYLQRRVFVPLGMTDTRTVDVAGGDVPGMDDGHITAYGAALPLREMTHYVGGSGGIVSTANDLGRWIAMQQRGGLAADGTRVLSAALIEESHTPQPEAKYSGLGWQQSVNATPERVGHSGALTRYSARVDLVPSSGVGVAVLLNSYTPTYEHPYAISSGLIDLSEGDPAQPGFPVATLVDAVLALGTLVVIGLTVRGVRRARVWAGRRAEWGPIRFGLRLLPQLVLPVGAGVLVLVLPLIEGNSATPVDVFGLWPAAIVLLLVGAAAGVVLIAVRLRARALVGGGPLPREVPHQGARPLTRERGPSPGSEAPDQGARPLTKRPPNR